MVLLFLSDDPGDCSDGGFILSRQGFQLKSKMCQDHPLDRDGGCRNCTAAKQCSRKSENVASKTAQQIASAARSSTPPQFGFEDGSVRLFVALEFPELCNQGTGGQSGDEDLAGVDVNRTVLSGVIDLQDARAE